MMHKIQKKVQSAVVSGLTIGVMVLLQSTVAHAQGIGLKTFEEYIVPTPTKIEKGKELFADKCAYCHGAEGQGSSEGAALTPPAAVFINGKFKSGGGPVSIYNVFSVAGSYPRHKIFGNYTDEQRWNLVHFIRSLSDTSNLFDSDRTLRVAATNAIEGVCKPEIKSTISGNMAFKGADQVAKGKEIFETICFTCHGKEGKGDGVPSDPKPRDFTSTTEKWKNGTSILEIFNTISNGIPNSTMIGYSAQYKEDEIYALAHFINQTFMPESIRVDVTDEAIEKTCKTLSGPKKPDTSLTVDQAIEAILAEQPEKAVIKGMSYGPAYLSDQANADRGKEVYQTYCSSCHGANGQGPVGKAANDGKGIGPYGAFKPYLYLKVSPLSNLQAGGSAQVFAERSAFGVHATIPNMTSASVLSQDQWSDLQAFVASFDGPNRIQVGGQVQKTEIQRIQEILARPASEDPVEVAPSPETDEGEQAESPKEVAKSKKKKVSKKKRARR